MNTSLISISIFIFIIIIFLVIFVLIGISKQLSFVSSDGSRFKTKSELKDYERLVEKFKPLYTDRIFSSNSPSSTLSLDDSFIQLLTKSGFNDIKILIKNKNNFLELAKILNDNPD